MAALDSPNFAEAREYVQQELAAMGGRALPEEELDTYTREFLRLVKEREVTPCSTPTSSTVSRPHTASSATRSAVYKTFSAGGKENRIDLPASPAHYHSFTTDDWTAVHNTSDQRKIMKRKVYGSDAATSSCEEETLPPLLPSMRSFIPPAQSHPHTRGLRKADPVSRYHEYREMWEKQQPPGVSNRNGLRWQIREHMIQQQQQHKPAHSSLIPPAQPNNYIIPSNKKRQRLRWDIRTRLAQQTL